MTGSDPRPLFSRALDQTEEQVRAVRTGELTNSTPCSEYDVRALLGHIVAVLRKIATAGGEGDVSEMPDVVNHPDDDWEEAFERVRAEVEHVWADDAVLDRTLTLPWAQMPGRDVLDAYTHELTVHSWDLASATSRLSKLDPDLGASALAWFETAMPVVSRDGEDRFGSAVDAPEDADVYTRLAAHTGRRP